MIIYTKHAQSLHKLYPNVEMIMTKCPQLEIAKDCKLLKFHLTFNKYNFRQSYILFQILIIEICYNKQIHEM